MNATSPAPAGTDRPALLQTVQVFRTAIAQFHKQGEGVWPGRPHFLPTALFWRPEGSTLMVLADASPEEAAGGASLVAAQQHAVAAALTFQTTIDLTQIHRPGDSQLRQQALPGQDPHAHPALCTVGTWPGIADAVLLSLVAEAPDRQIRRLGSFPDIPAPVQHCADWLTATLPPDDGDSHGLSRTVTSTAGASDHLAEPCESPDPGQSSAHCSCGLTITTPLRSLAAGWIRDHPKAATRGTHPKTSIYKLHPDTLAYCEQSRCRQPHSYAALCAGPCGTTWTAPIKAIVEEDKRNHHT